MSQNTAVGGDQRGGGIHVREGGSVTLEDTVVDENEANLGGGVMLEDSCSLSMDTTSSITANTALSRGAGVYADPDSTISGGTVSLNASEGAGGGLTVFGPATLSGVVVDQNTGAAGAGLDLDGDIDITGCTISDNAALSEGGGVMARIGTVTLHSTIVQGNTAADGGGGMVRGTVLIGGVFTGNTATRGGGLSIANSTEASVLEDVVLEDNEALPSDGRGGGLFAISDFTATGLTLASNVGVQGGGFCAEQLLGVIEASSCDGNAAQDGGCGYLNEGLFGFDNSSAVGNAASGTGGGIVAFQPSGGIIGLNLEQDVFEANTAAQGGAIWSNGVVAISGSDLATGPNDNTPDDVVQIVSGTPTSYSYGANVTVSCTNVTGCN